ncbi:MAG: hypothetical protein KBS56_03755 [Clostridiales bacterium]|nr:hypothetical protein [Candidatus Crickella equi]
MNKNIKKRIALLLTLAITMMATFAMFSLDIYAQPHGRKPVVGATYKLKEPKYVYRNHNKKSGVKKVAELSDTAKKFVIKGKKKARFRKGTVVTCLEVHKDWIRIPSGWMKYNHKDFKRIKMNRG